MVACRTPRTYFRMRSIPISPLDITMRTWRAHQVWIDRTLCLNPHFYTLFKFSFGGSVPTEGISNKWHIHTPFNSAILLLGMNPNYTHCREYKKKKICTSCLLHIVFKNKISARYQKWPSTGVCGIRHRASQQLGKMWME